MIISQRVMNTTELESLIQPIEVQENANASSSCSSLASTINNNCQPSTTGGSQTILIGNIENDSPPNIQSINNCSSTTNSLSTMKVFAPVMKHDVILPNTAKKVSMVMVPVPDSGTVMGIPLSTLSQLKETQMATASKDEQQAREILVWNDGIGSLDGCDLRFKINQLGCLELVDSDDESEANNNNRQQKQNVINTNNKIHNNKNQASSRNTRLTSSSSAANSNNNKQNAISATMSRSNNDVTNIINNKTTTTPNRVSTQEKLPKKAKLDGEPSLMRQISPGSSLLRDGPNTRRPIKTSSSATTTTTATSTSMAASSLLNKSQVVGTTLDDRFDASKRNKNNDIMALHRLEASILDQLVPNRREIKTSEVQDWTIEEVKSFIDSIPGCSGYGDLFELQQICGKSLMYLDQKDLLDVINVKLGPAVKIYNAISLLK